MIVDEQRFVMSKPVGCRFDTGETAGVSTLSLYSSIALALTCCLVSLSPVKRVRAAVVPPSSDRRPKQKVCIHFLLRVGGVAQDIATGGSIRPAFC